MKCDITMNEAALTYLISANKKEMAKKLNISYTTCKNLCKKPEFLDALSELRQSTFSKAMAKTALYSDDAIQELHRMGMDKNTPPTSKVAALRALVDASFSSFQIQEIEPLLREIKERKCE